MKWRELIKRRLEKYRKMIPEEVKFPLSQCCGQPVIRDCCMKCGQQVQTIPPSDEVSPRQTEPSSDSDCH